MPSQPASSRAYSPRSAWSRIRATTGAAARNPAILPSAVDRSICLSTDLIANSNSRFSRRDQLTHGSVAALLTQVARIEPAGLDGDEGLRREALILAERAQRGLLPGFVAVEREDHLTADGGARGEHHARRATGTVPQQPPHHPHVLGPEGRAAGRDRRRHARQVHRHHVGVSLDDDDLLALGDLPLRRGRSR